MEYLFDYLSKFENFEYPPKNLFFIAKIEILGIEKKKLTWISN